ncbi:hypothetical protein F441_14028 [Phytophthora nicotianae CJ01A1]|uniref:Uncharacterized protein n=3 Tax=Phytophthora nicotianae TaxID=4792 RepID=V9ENS1_PHYNI|nr:hypothetical protein F443_14100 [Phytophthora nicotianae P1569]ETO69207.1 hypothetical protein F444_14131 [Phytophthora nicotianae P1976]ETP10325.1 hypothetical protein F441_14028 [Phytophthora nicotianae CJ01A1]
MDGEDRNVESVRLAALRWFNPSDLPHSVEVIPANASQEAGKQLAERSFLLVKYPLNKMSSSFELTRRMHRNHLDPTRYVDTKAFEDYQHYKGQELVVSECVVGSPSEVFDAWLEEVWLTGGTELHEGVGRGYVGHVRGAPLGIEEEIISAGLPIDEPVDSDGGRPSLAAARRSRSKIPSISYKINKFGLFPIQDHLAFVQFVDVAASPESTPATLVIWSLKMEPSTLGYLLCCGGFAKVILRSALQGFLGTLARNAATRADRHLE